MKNLNVIKIDCVGQRRLWQWVNWKHREKKIYRNEIKRASHSGLLSYERISYVDYNNRTLHVWAGPPNKFWCINNGRDYTKIKTHTQTSDLNALQSLSAHYSFGSKQMNNMNTHKIKKKTNKHLTYYSFNVVRGMNALCDCFACLFLGNLQTHSVCMSACAWAIVLVSSIVYFIVFLCYFFSHSNFCQWCDCDFVFLHMQAFVVAFFFI